MKKIHFSNKYGLMQAVMSRRKTMTRRFVHDGTHCELWSKTDKYLRYQVGEVVAIAQSYRSITEEDKEINGVLGIYRIGQKYLTMDEMGAGWRNKLFVRADLMPHHIRTTNVKIERLQDISDIECFKEGIEDYSTPAEKRYGYADFERETIFVFRTPREAFASLIDRISGKGTWNKNPYVAAYKFELID